MVTERTAKIVNALRAQFQEGATLTEIIADTLSASVTFLTAVSEIDRQQRGGDWEVTPISTMMAMTEVITDNMLHMVDEGQRFALIDILHEMLNDFENENVSTPVNYN